MIEKEEIEGRLEPKTKKYYDRFFICESCDKVYWRGGHWQRMKKEIESILSGANSSLANK